MGALVDGFGGKISGELTRASDWNGMLAAVEALVSGVQTAIEARLIRWKTRSRTSALASPPSKARSPTSRTSPRRCVRGIGE